VLPAEPCDLGGPNQWIGKVGVSIGRYLVKTGHAHDAGRTIEIEVCDDPECEAADYDRMC
jgi:hypothetical protein